MAARKHFETCPMLARSDWGLSNVNSKGLSLCISSVQSAVGFHGPKVAGWLVFLNGCHRGEDMRLPVGESQIGSSWLNDCIVTGVGVGSQHAVIKAGVGEANIIPVAANRVVKVNNNLISGRQVLDDGSLITIGEVHCIYRSADAFSPGYIPSVTPVPIHMPAQTLPLEVVCGWLVFNRGVCTGQDFRLIHGSNRIGSMAGLELSLPDPNISSHALTIEASSKECKIQWAKDYGLVRVNGREAQAGQALVDSDVVEIDHLEAYVKWLRS
jgi:hypothetical protein